MTTREDVLRDLVARRAPSAEALLSLAAFHQRRGSPALREGIPTRAGHHYPHSQDIEPLLALFVASLDALWKECRSASDDLHVAAFAAYAVLAIYPFQDSNARTSLDFANYLLMNRWAWSRPPIQWSSEEPRELAVVRMFDATAPKGEVSQDSIVKEGLRVAWLLADARVHALYENPLFHDAAAYFAASSQPVVRDSFSELRPEMAEDAVAP